MCVACLGPHHVFDRLGSMQQEPLRVVDADLAHPLQQRWPVHALGHRPDADHARHVDETAYRGGVEGIVDQVTDEAAVDFEQVVLQGLQVAERRSAGTEVVQRNAHAQRAHLFDEG